MVIVVVGASDSITFCVDSPIEKDVGEAALEVKRRASWRRRKGVRWRPGEGPIERALTSYKSR